MGRAELDREDHLDSQSSEHLRYSGIRLSILERRIQDSTSVLMALLCPDCISVSLDPHGIERV